jgi:hypothetical protein
MKQITKRNSFESQERPQSGVSEIGLRVIDNPYFSPGRIQTVDVCEYIEKITRELTKTAIEADQALLAFLLGAAAQEARFQAGRIHLGK